MEHQLMQRPAQSVKKQLEPRASVWYNTHDQQLDTAQQLWADWWENQRPAPKRMFVGSGEDVCLNTP